MRLFRGSLWPCAVVLLAAATTPSHAAWNNVFQVCCNDCGQRPAVVSGYAAAPCPQPCPQQCCTTQWQQRCYYEPVTTMQTRTYQEPVTSYKTSYYYEPVTTYRTSCYYDPCSCSYHQVSTPCTSLQLRSQTCAVQSWVQRCYQVPVTTQRQVSYWEPVTTCSTPAPAPCPPNPCPTANQPGSDGRPAISENRAPGSAGISESHEGGTSYNRNSISPPIADPGTRQYAPGRVQPVPANPQSAPPSVKFDQIVALPPANVEGQILRDETHPFAGAAVVFLSLDQKGVEQRSTANASGQFRVNLASGTWRVYVSGQDGKLVYQRKIEIGNEKQTVTLVSR